MQWLCDHFYLFILLLFAAHLLGFRWLWRERSRQAVWLAEHLQNLIQGFASRADRDPYPTVDEQIDSFLANIREALSDPSRQRDRRALHDQIVAKDETKKYLRGSRFETFYNLARTGIEIYPLLGIMGTVLAIGLALHSQDAGDAASATERIVRNFAGSIWATLAGIGCGVVLLLVNAVLEPAFQRLLDHRWEVRETISAVKNELGASKAQ
jgi:biopolymer transport protein ExbB/TolQ